MTDTTEAQQPQDRKELILGGSYVHQGVPGQYYTVICTAATTLRELNEAGYTDATGFEQTGRLPETTDTQIIKNWVLYRQKYDGEHKENGTLWCREVDDWNASTKNEAGVTIPNFTLVAHIL